MMKQLLIYILVMLILGVVIVVRVASGSAPVSTGLDLSTLAPGGAPLSAINSQPVKFRRLVSLC